jgi:hypothetical protein
LLGINRDIDCRSELKIIFAGFFGSSYRVMRSFRPLFHATESIDTVYLYAILWHIIWYIHIFCSRNFYRYIRSPLFFFALGIGLHWSFQPTHRLDIFQRKRRSSLHQKEPSVESGSVDFRRSTLRWSSEGVTILKIRFSKKITDADLSQKIFQSFLSFF